MYKQIIIYKYNSGRNILANPKKKKKNCSGPRNVKMKFDNCFCEILNQNYESLASGRKYNYWILFPYNFGTFKILSLKLFGN